MLRKIFDGASPKRWVRYRTLLTVQRVCSIPTQVMHQYQDPQCLTMRTGACDVMGQDDSVSMHVVSGHHGGYNDIAERFSVGEVGKN